MSLCKKFLKSRCWCLVTFCVLHAPCSGLPRMTLMFSLLLEHGDVPQPWCSSGTAGSSLHRPCAPGAPRGCGLYLHTAAHPAALRGWGSRIAPHSKAAISAMLTTVVLIKFCGKKIIAAWCGDYIARFGNELNRLKKMEAIIVGIKLKQCSAPVCICFMCTEHF